MKIPISRLGYIKLLLMLYLYYWDVITLIIITNNVMSLFLRKSQVGNDL